MKTTPPARPSRSCPEELERRLVELRDAADRAGFGNVAFTREAEQKRRDRAERQADVRDLYLPPSA